MRLAGTVLYDRHHETYAWLELGAYLLIAGWVTTRPEFWPERREDWGVLALAFVCCFTIRAVMLYRRH